MIEIEMIDAKLVKEREFPYGNPRPHHLPALPIFLLSL